MPRLGFAAVGALGLLLSATAVAHQKPASHRVVVQANADSASVLVTYRPPLSSDADASLSAAMFGKRGGAARNALKAAIAKRALAPLQLVVDGKPARYSAVETKIVLDRRGQRYTAYVLATIANTGSGLEARVTEETARVSWLDRSARRATSATPTAHWIKRSDRLAITWK